MADLKAGTTVAGAAIWNASNLQVIPAGNFLTYRGFKVYTSGDKPTATDLGFLPAAGGAMTGALTSNSNITSTNLIEGNQVRSNYRIGLYRSGGNTSQDFIRTDVITDDALPATSQTLGAIGFKEGSKTTDIHGGRARSYIQAIVTTDGNSNFQIDNRDNTGAVINRMVMSTSNGLTTIDYGGFKVIGATTLGTVNAGTTTVSRLISTSAIDAPSINLTNPSAGIELGSPTTAGTPFIDFKTNGSNVDYDIRLIANSTSFSLVSRATSIDSFNLKSIKKLCLNDTEASEIQMNWGTTVLKDFGNGNVTLSASRKSSSDTVGGDLYLGYNASGFYTKSVRLESPMTWKNANSLVDANGKLVGASLDTAYLPLTGGTLSNNITIAKNGAPYIDLLNSAIDTSTALPTSTQYSGLITFYENRAGSNMIRSRMESMVSATGETILAIYARDKNNATKVHLRLESDTGLCNLASGNFRVGGTSNLVGAVTVNSSLTAANNIYVNGTGNKHLWFGTGSGDGDKGLVYASDVGNLHLRSGDGGNNGSVFVLSRSLTVDGNIWANKQSHGFADQWTTVAPLHVDFGQVPGNSDYYPIVRGRSTSAGYGYPTQVELGMLRQGNTTWGTGYLIVRNSEQTGGPQANYSFDISGNFQAPGQVGGAKMAVGVGTNSLAGASIAIGDNDSGFTSGGDGIIQLWCNSGRVWHGDSGQFYVDKQIITPNNGTFNNVYISSDIRLKTNFRKIENALDKVEKLEGLIYDKKSKLDSEEYDTTEAGIIAQTLQEVLPEAVTEVNGILNVSSGATIALLVNAIKELKAKVEYLENK
ncbi:long tail fiber, distal subunit [Yersinia phage JC221]|nr:long tail fiber, distal subunit [Yersinia phage JC221]